MTCDEARESIDAFALGALDEEDARAVRAHLAACRECRRRAAEAAAAAHALPFALAAASPAVPPADLKQRVLGAIQADTAPVSAVPGAPARGRGGIRTLPVRWSWHRAAAAVAALVTVAAVIWSAHLSSALDVERATRARVEAFYQRQQELVLEVVDSAKTTRRVLLPPDGGGPTEPYGKLFTRADLPDIVAMVARMPAPPAGQAYRLWLTGGGTTVAAGVLSVDDQGFGLLTFEAYRPGPTYDAVEVRLQASSATAPDGAVVLRWNATEATG